MNDIIVHALPQTAPISDMRNRQHELLRMTENGPVVLLSRSKPSAVLLSPTQWNAIADALTDTQRRPESEPQTKDHQGDVDVHTEIAARAQSAAANEVEKDSLWDIVNLGHSEVGDLAMEHDRHLAEIEAIDNLQ